MRSTSSRSRARTLLHNTPFHRNRASGPAWSSDGEELLFLDAQGQVFAALVTTERAFGVAGVEPLFSGAGYDLPRGTPGDDGHPDGDRFLMVRRQGDEVVLVLNWLEELRAFMGDSN